MSRLVVAVAAVSIFAGWPARASADGPGGPQEDAASAYGPVRGGQVYNGTWSRAGDVDYWVFYTDRPDVPLRLRFGNDYDGECNPFPDTGYDTCYVNIQVFDPDDAPVFNVWLDTTSVDAGWEYNNSDDPKTLSTPGRYYIQVSGDEDFETEGEPDFAAMPYHFELLQADGLGVDPPKQVPPPPILQVWTLFPPVVKQHFETLKEAYEAYGDAKDAADLWTHLIVGVADPELELGEVAVGELLSAEIKGGLDLIINDPPQANYKRVVTEHVLRLQRIRAHRHLTRRAATALTKLYRDLAMESAASRATLAAFERFKGAQQQSDTAWELTHLRALGKYAAEWAQALQAEPALRAFAATQLRHSHYRTPRPSRRTVARLRRQLRKHGLTRKQRHVLAGEGVDSRHQRIYLRRFLRGGRLSFPNLRSAVANHRAMNALPQLLSAVQDLRQQAVDGISYLGG